MVGPLYAFPRLCTSQSSSGTARIAQIAPDTPDSHPTDLSSYPLSRTRPRYARQNRFAVRVRPLAQSNGGGDLELGAHDAANAPAKASPLCAVWPQRTDMRPVRLRIRPTRELAEAICRTLAAAARLC